MEALKETMGALVEKGQELTFVIIENVDHPDEFVQYQLHGGVVYGEVSSRQWDPPGVPLSSGAVIALGKLGFASGGAMKNFSCDGLALDPAKLARLAEKLFQAAYGRGPAVDVVVHTNNPDVFELLKQRGCWVGRLLAEPDRTVRPLDLGDIESFLRSRGCVMLRNQQSGSLMTFWGWDDDLGTEVKIWFSVEADGQVLRILGSGDRPLRGKRRWPEALRACNEWNSNKRWPMAYLSPADLRGKTFGWIMTSMEVPIRTGIHRPMVEDIVDTAVTATLDCYRYLHQELDWSTVTALRRAR